MPHARRFPQNPLIRPSDVPPSRDGMQVACVLNPGVFRYDNRIGLLLRVAERPAQTPGWISTPVLEPGKPGGIDILRFPESECAWIDTGRIFTHSGRSWLTTLSHLRLAWSDDGIHFEIAPAPTLAGRGPQESFGIEDCRVTKIGDTYHLNYTAVSPDGFGVSYATTRDWKTFAQHGVIIPPPNKDFALFPEKIGNYYYALHRPTHTTLGGPYIWISRSPDLMHWGDHRCVARPRPGKWDSQKLGAGGEPIRTKHGWLEIYHGVSESHQYSLGLLLFDLRDPTKLLARSETPIMTPQAPCELTGFFGNVVFTNGHIINGDQITIYYGASDEYICAGTFSLRVLLATLTEKLLSFQNMGIYMAQPTREVD